MNKASPEETKRALKLIKQFREDEETFRDIVRNEVISAMKAPDENKLTRFERMLLLLFGGAILGWCVQKDFFSFLGLLFGILMIYIAGVTRGEAND